MINHLCHLLLYTFCFHESIQNHTIVFHRKAFKAMFHRLLFKVVLLHMTSSIYSKSCKKEIHHELEIGKHFQHQSWINCLAERKSKSLHLSDIDIHYNQYNCIWSIVSSHWVGMYQLFISHTINAYIFEVMFYAFYISC